ncbi:MAG: ammonium transporter, partial [Steroidobacter sp.]
MKRSLATSRVLTYLWSAVLFALTLMGPEMTLAQESPPAEVAAAEAATMEGAAEAAPAAAPVPDKGDTSW